ncbi:MULTISPECIES: restriction endonuclease subunit S [unclassified Thioalkalivibrio]|uniref:restriction endonuclease subunit S n=1 Tax=unclassified Thioalkalivibrio TaxID=2621013 RepID=UPI00037F807C|nr:MULTISPECIES: restriction endonuclease subunit S [unclassified Thioalkalivibrio]
MAERSEAVEEQAVRDGSAVYSVEPDIATAEDLPPGYKRTEVGVIPEDWRVEALAYFVSALHAGVSVNSSTSDQPIDDVPSVLKTSCIQAGIFSPDQAKPITPKDRSRAKLSPKAETILISRMNTPNLVGESGFVGKDYDHLFLPDRIWMTIFRQTVRFSPRWLAYILSSPEYRKYLKEIATGTSGSMKNIAKGSLLNLKVPCPVEKEQRAIATALSDADALIESLDRLIAKKRAIKQAAMQQLLTGQTRLPGFTGEWETKRLGDISTIAMGRTPSRNNTAFWGRGHVWLSIADLHGKVVKESKEQITDLAAAGMTPIPEGTLLMSFKLSIGRLCFAGCDLFTNEAICSFTDLQADEEFIYYALSRTDFSLYGKQAVKGYTLNSESLKLVEVFLPPEDEQTAIATVLSDMDTEIEALERRRDKARQIKQGMMQQLLTGRVRLVKPGKAA